MCRCSFANIHNIATCYMAVVANIKVIEGYTLLGPSLLHVIVVTWAHD